MKIDSQLLNKVSGQAAASPRLRMNYNLHESVDAPAQRLLNALEPGTVLPVHRHNHTDETYILLRGKIDVMFYSAEGTETERIHLNPLDGNYGVHIARSQWHSLEVLEPAVIFEVKDGPYTPLQPEDLLAL